MPPFVVRRVDIKNALIAAAIKELHDECFPPPDVPYTPTEGAWWILFAGNEEAGFAGIRESYRVAGTGYLLRSGVLPKFRGQGLQKRLIRTRLNYAKRQGWIAATTDTNRNPASSNSLINCGFKLYEPENPWGFITTLYWRKQL